MLISVVIRSRNDNAFIARTMNMLLKQRLLPGHELELVNIDNQSLDGTAEQILKLNPQGIHLGWPVGEYMPGAVLNYAISRSHGEVVVFNNSDAVPLDEDYLEKLIAPILDSRADAVFAQQVARPGARYLVRKDYERAFGDGEISRHWRHFFSLASAAVRRDVWEAQRFNEQFLYSEDVEWSWRLKKRGFRVMYVAAARVEHSHNYDFRGTARRFYNEGVADRLIFGDRRTWLRSFFMPLCRELSRDFSYLTCHSARLQDYGELWYRVVQRRYYHSGWRHAESAGWWR